MAIERKLSVQEIKDRLLDLEVCDVFLEIENGDLVAIKLHDFAGSDVFTFRANQGSALLTVSVSDQEEEDEEE